MASWAELNRKLETLLNVFRTYEKGVGTSTINFTELKAAIADIENDLEIIKNSIPKKGSILALAHLFIKDIETTNSKYAVMLDRNYDKGVALFIKSKTGNKKGTVVASIFASDKGISLTPELGFNGTSDEEAIIRKLAQIFKKEPTITEAN